MRTTTSSADGFGTVTFSSHSSSLASEVILLRSSRLLIVVILIASLLRACRPVASFFLFVCHCTTNDKVNEPYRIEMPKRMYFRSTEAIDVVP
jgi:hypothetical protein